MDKREISIYWGYIYGLQFHGQGDLHEKGKTSKANH